MSKTIRTSYESPLVEEEGCSTDVSLPVTGKRFLAVRAKQLRNFLDKNGRPLPNPSYSLEGTRWQDYSLLPSAYRN